MSLAFLRLMGYNKGNGVWKKKLSNSRRAGEKKVPKLPIGMEDFKELIQKDYYYVDKSMFIREIMKDKVCLYTRPRRFGKTLNMSMLYYFFSNREKTGVSLFETLAISKDEEIMKHQNGYPVIFLTLKDMREPSFESVIEAFGLLISDLIGQFEELMGSKALNPSEVKRLNALFRGEASVTLLGRSLQLLSLCLKKHYGKNVILLIDEYDVPLQNAYLHGYYDEMTSFLKNLFSTALKTNDALEHAVLTGCFQIAKESIFTGLNNFCVYSILDEQGSAYFGFTQQEMDQLLNNCHLNQYRADMKKWYDGYLFGNTEIYNPWSTLMYANQLMQTSDVYARSYWANTSSNDIVYDYIRHGTQAMKDDFDTLILGGSIKKVIKPELTYREMDDINNVYSFLLFSGYLRVEKRLDWNRYELMIPNYEIQTIYENLFHQWAEEIQNQSRMEFIRALLDKDVEKANEILNYILLQSMSYYDSQESFYHGFLMGLLAQESMYSNIESGDGRCDIKYLPVDKEKSGFILELKVCREKDLYDTAVEACQQIVDMRYLESDYARGYRHMIGYGIAFEKKRCFIKMLAVKGKTKRKKS